MRAKRVLFSLLSLLTAVLFAACSADTIPILSRITGEEADRVVIDAIGEIRYMQEKAELAIVNAKAEIPRLQRLEAEEFAEASLLERRIVELQQTSDSMGLVLLKLADLLDAGEPYTSTVSGKVISVQELRSYAETQKAKYEDIQTQLTVLAESRQIRQTNAENAHGQWKAAEQAVQLLSAKQQLLNAKITQLELLKSQSASMGGTASIDSVIADARNVLSEATSEIDKQILVTEKLRDFKVAEVEQADLSQELLGITGGGDDAFANELRNLVTKPGE